MGIYNKSESRTTSFPYQLLNIILINIPDQKSNSTHFRDKSVKLHNHRYQSSEHRMESARVENCESRIGRSISEYPPRRPQMWRLPNTSPRMWRPDFITSPQVWCPLNASQYTQVAFMISGRFLLQIIMTPTRRQ